MYTKKRYDALVKEAARQIREANMDLAEKEIEIRQLKEVIRGICYRGRRADGTRAYYDWCCAYCANKEGCPTTPKHWCEGFTV